MMLCMMQRYDAPMRTTVDVDQYALEAAKEALGTTQLSETVNAALRSASRRHRLKNFDIRDFPIMDSPEEIKRARTQDRLHASVETNG
jgi:hypothetical protein